MWRVKQNCNRVTIAIIDIIGKKDKNPCSILKVGLKVVSEKYDMTDHRFKNTKEAKHTNKKKEIKEVAVLFN